MRSRARVARRGGKKAHIGNTVAQIWIEANGEKIIEVDWSELSADEEADIIRVVVSVKDVLSSNLE